MPPLIVLGAAWLAGMAWAGLWNAPPWLPGLTLLLLLPLTGGGVLRLSPWLLVVAAGCATAGAWRLDDGSSSLPPLAAWTGETITVVGHVTSLPDPGRTTVRYEVAVLSVDGESEADTFEGAVLATVDQYTDWPIGTRVRLEGELEAAPVFPDFDYRGYLARQGIAGTMFFPRAEVLRSAPWSRERAVGAARSALEDSLQRSLPEPEASLASGIALGLDGNIPNELYDDYRRSGLAHIIAVSGSNVALLTAMIFVVLVPLVGRYAAIAPAAVVVVLYVFVAGAEASVVRAGVMATIFLVGLALGRQQSGVAALAAAAVLMTAVDPGAAREIGFQLSLAATAGLLVFGPWFAWLLSRWLPAAARPFVPDGLVSIVAWTLASTLATAPLLWLYFGELSIVGVVANVVAQPVFAVALGLSLATAFLGATWQPLGGLAGVVAWYPLAFMNEVAAVLGSPEWASVEARGATGSRVALLVGVLLAAGGWAFLRPPPMNGEFERPSGLPVRRYGYAAVAGALVVGGWWFTVRPLAADNEVTVAFLDVGQGDAALITTPGGHQVLIDGGPSGIELMRELGAVMPHWDRSIDAVVLSHPQQDHLSGLVELGRRFDVKTVYDAGATNSSGTFARYHDEFGARTPIRAGHVFELDGVRFEVLWPHTLSGDPNQDSLVLSMEYGGRSILFTGDIEATPQVALLAGASLDTDVLKVPHHGAATSERAFFDAVNAGIAVISVGTNTFGHPREETIEALAPAQVLRTDQHGRVVVTIGDDGEVRYRVERP